MKSRFSLIMLTTLLGVAACSDDKNTYIVDDRDVYEVTVTNLTHQQPLSPVALVAHGHGYAGWQEGMAASEGLELLAEGGDASGFLEEAEGSDAFIGSVAGEGPIGGGHSETFTLEIPRSSHAYLTVATMLVNTNDGFTGVNAIPLHLDVGDMSHYEAVVWDAGTEANTEGAATIPGPAGGGEGFNAARETRNMVAIHSGVVSSDEGLEESALTSEHKFDLPGAMISISRVQ